MKSWHSLFLALTVGLASLAATAADVGRLKTAKGDVVVLRTGQQLKAEVGMPLQHSDHVITRADSSAGITFDDNSIMSLGPDSVLEINRFSYGAPAQADELEATLQRGTLSAVSGKIVKNSPEAMRIRTPTTILGVRGTEFFVKVTNPKP